MRDPWIDYLAALCVGGVCGIRMHIVHRCFPKTHSQCARHLRSPGLETNRETVICPTSFGFLSFPYHEMVCSILQSTVTHATPHSGHVTYKAFCTHSVWQHFPGHLSVLWFTALASLKNLWRDMFPSSVECSSFNFQSSYCACRRHTCSTMGSSHFYDKAVLSKN